MFQLSHRNLVTSAAALPALTVPAAAVVATTNSMLISLGAC